MKKQSIALLATIVAAGVQGTFAEEKALTELLTEKLVEVNPEMKNDKNEIAVRATEAGMNYGKEQKAETAPAQGQLFALASVAIPIPEAKRAAGAGRTGKYPFDKMEVGQSFFVAATAEQDQEALFKSLGSTALSAKRRYAVETGETKTNKAGESVPVLDYKRVFEVRRIDDGAPWDAKLAGVKGVACWRME
jgi:hypothetical protein